MPTAIALGAIASCFLQIETHSASRTISQLLPSHPGNIFVRGEQVIVPAPKRLTNAAWRAIDHDRKTVTEGRLESGCAQLGALPAGYYELACGEADGTNRVSLGKPVLALRFARAEK